MPRSSFFIIETIILGIEEPLPVPRFLSVSPAVIIKKETLAGERKESLVSATKKKKKKRYADTSWNWSFLSSF